MNKKILVVSILAVFTLVAISFASAINTTAPVEKKESPLFRIRSRRAIREKIGDLVRRFLGDRIFFLPFQWLRNIIDDYQQPFSKSPTCHGIKSPCTKYQWTCPTECCNN